ncbi:WcbI family polysaccharide biosynthesis putative acetyltransferase [Pseudoalteromonas sp. C8]|uniref:WcbI family polysaccharide biosynthesis putative acetyltransferase n=1 Tax=Pseudoalteromonas sp. C8 TaxID=2686345 RepID=UPI0013FD97DF|nr:WcbI family polysaccharide biosynthesis putative acetyltransferase [Pseudoalteromonas sp. C8]
MTNKKKVVVVGNCQARPIASLLEAMSDEIEVTKVAIVHLLNSVQEAEYKPFFEEADYIIAQLVSDNYPCKFVQTDLLAQSYGHKLVKIVNLFSYADTPYLRNLPKNLRGAEPPFGDYHFPVVYECWESGKDINTAVLELNKQNNNAAKQADSYEELAAREKLADVAIVDYIKNAKHRLFHTFNHPRNNLLLEYTKRILKRLKLKELPLNEKPAGAFLGQFIPFMKSGESPEHKLIKDKKVVLKTTGQLVKDFYDFYKKNMNSQSKSIEETIIPKVIVQYWDGELPAEIKKLTDTWKKNNPEFEYKIFNHEQAVKFIRDHYDKKASTLFLKAKLPAMQSDIFRVAYCLAKGGLYVDAATSCNKSLIDLFNRPKSLQVMRKWHGGIWNGFILTAAQHPVLNNIWNKILYNLDCEVGVDVWSTTGPGLFNEFCKGSNNLDILDQTDLSKYFSLVNELQHKKKNHWSQVQKGTSIFNAPSDRVAKPRIILHLGPHKTGTTSFQNILEKNEGLLTSESIGLITIRSNFSDSYKSLRNDYTKVLQAALLVDKADEEVVIIKLANILNSIVETMQGEQPSIKKILISDENLLGPLVGHYFANRKGRERNFYTLHKLVFSAMKVAFGSNLEQVILGDRGCEHFIKSSYKDFISKLTDAESLKYFRDNLSSSVDEQYDMFFKNAELIFNSKLKVFNFDVFCKNMIAIINEILSVEIDKEQDSLTANASISQRGIDIALKVIPELKSSKEVNQFRKFLNSVS